LSDKDPLEPQGYLTQLDGVRVREVTGAIDFDVLAKKGRELFS